MKKNLEKNKNHAGWKFLFSLLILILIGLVAITSMIGAGYYDSELFKELGPWGDFFGGVLNPVLTFLTFFGVLITIVLQKIELSLTRDELERSANALESQIGAIEKQSFESTFFQMLSLHNNIVNSIDLYNLDTERNTQGRDCFRVFYSRLRRTYHEINKKYTGTRTEDEIIETSYKIFWRDYQLELGHYYRYLYNIIKFIEMGPYRNEHYIKLVRAQLSDQELLLLFYNCLSPQGKNFKFYAEEFSLFDNMPDGRLLDSNHKDRFDPTAFGNAAAI